MGGGTTETVTNMTHLTCTLINARSLVNKRQEMESLIYEHSPATILVTESLACEDVADGELVFEGYSIIRHDRDFGKDVGCLIMFKAEYNIINEQLTDTHDTDTVWCHLITQDAKILTGVCYNTTANNKEEQESLHKLMKKACKLETEVEVRQFQEVVLDCFLTQHITEPTREGKTLDLVLTDNENMVENVVVREPFRTSDHNIIQFDVICNVETSVEKAIQRLHMWQLQ